MNAASMEISMGELKKLEINYHMIQLYTTCGYTPEGLKSEYGRDIFSSVFTVALFTIANILNQPTHLSTDE